LHGLYAVAVQRQSDTNFVLDSAASVVSDDWLLDAASLNAPIDAPLSTPSPRAVPTPTPAPVPAQRFAQAPPPAARRVQAATLQGLGELNIRAEIVESKRTLSSASPASAKGVVEAPVRRTLPPPPLPRTSTPPPPSSLTPSAQTVPAPHLAAQPARTPWAGVAAVTGMTAVAASVITVFALRGSSLPSAAAAGQPRPAAVDVLPPVSAPAYPQPLVASASPTAPATAPASASTASAPAPAVPAELRKPTITATPPSSPVKVVPPAPPPRPAQRVAAQPAAPAPATPSAISAADDEFGGRQ
jgi:hypothetical protein